MRKTTSGKVRQDNLMFNTDVVRGNTWASAALTKMKEAQPAPKKSPTRRKQMVAGIDVAPPDGLSTPRPVAGRQHFEMQTEAMLEEWPEATCTQTEEEYIVPVYEPPPKQCHEIAVQCDNEELQPRPEMVDCETATSTEAVVELQDDWLAAQQQEEHEAMLRQLAALEQAEQDAEVARIATEARLQQDNEYAATSACYQYSLTFVQGIFEFAMSYVQVDADFLEADEVSIAPSKAMVKVASKKGSGLKDLLQAAAEGQRHFSIKFDSRFETMLAGLPNGEVKEEDLEGLVKWATL